MRRLSIYVIFLLAMGCTKDDVAPNLSTVKYSIECGSCFVQFEVNGSSKEKHFATHSWTFNFTGHKGEEVRLRATNENLNGGDVTVSIFINDKLFLTDTSRELIVITQPAYASYRTSSLVHGWIP